MIVEDQKEVREGLRYLLELDGRIRVIKTFDRADSLLESLPTLAFPDIILMDIGLPGLNGIDAIRELKRNYPQITVIVFTVFEDEETLLESIRAGAKGYILKNTKPELLLEQIISAASGGAPISPRVARRLLEEIQRTNVGEKHENYGLTGRETQVLRLIVEGLTYREIAGRYSIAASTVKKHILHIYQKLGVRTKAEFVRKAIQEKLV